jgi:hypothetical protein
MVPYTWTAFWILTRLFFVLLSPRRAKKVARSTRAPSWVSVERRLGFCPSFFSAWGKTTRYAAGGFLLVVFKNYVTKESIRLREFVSFGIGFRV